MSHLSIHTTVLSHSHSSNNSDNNSRCPNMQCILPPPPPQRGVLTTILNIIFMTLTTMTIIPIIDINDVFTPVAAEGGNLNDRYLPFAYPVDCCAYELSGTTEDFFPPLPLILADPRDKTENGNTFFWPAGSRQIVPRKSNNDTNNANNTNSNTDYNNSNFESKCSGSTFSVWYGYFDINFPVEGWTMNEWNPPPAKGEPVHIENNDIWATSTTSIDFHRELYGRLIKVDLECTPPLQSVPPQQNCILLWLGIIHTTWRHRYGGGQCIGATTTIVPPRPSNHADSTFRDYVSSIRLFMMMLISLQLMWHIIL